MHTHKGFEQAIENYLKWIGGVAVGTPTIGTPIMREQMIGGKMMKVATGKHMMAQGGRGKQDRDCIYKGINFKLECKVGNDYQKPDQIAYQKRIESAGGVYIIVRTMQQVYDIIDKIDAGISLKGELFA